MPLEPADVINFLSEADDKYNSELLDLLITRINKLCFEECQIDRIACTLTPKCSRRFLLKMRIKNGLSIEDLPKFCYSVHKNVVLRDFRNKTVVYRPFDAYLYLIDFLDIFFHGDYRKLNKFISFKQWEEVEKILRKRIEKSEPFNYKITDNHLIVKYEDKIHVVYIEEKYVICNALRENISSLEILQGLCELYAKFYFPEVSMRILKSNRLRISTKVPAEIVQSIAKHLDPEQEPNKKDNYFWNIFWDDLGALMDLCDQIQIRIRRNDDLIISLYLDLLTNKLNRELKQMPLQYKDLRLILNFIYKMYNEFYVIWVKKPERLLEI